MNRQQPMQQDSIRYEQERSKQAVVSSPPRWVTLGIIGSCTNRCLFCSYHSKDARNGNSNIYNLKYTIPLEYFKKYIDPCHAGRVPHVHICEP
jgi:2-iminoacetate synthase ThiH